jgi:sugar phosphate isomerase/epimerase
MNQNFNTFFMNRREFINKSAALVALSGIACQEMFASTAAKRNKGRIGVQLYSIRKEITEDFMGSLKKLSDIGYSRVEPYGFTTDKFLGHSMKELSKIVKDLGMRISGTHTRSELFPENLNDPKWDFWKKCATELKSGGAKWATQSSLPMSIKTMDDLKRTATFFNLAGEVCKKNGVKFAFHNHMVELEKIDGVVMLDYLIQNTDPKLVYYQMDMGHVLNGGDDCMRFIRSYPGRIPLWHASDFNVATRQYTELGEGNVPYKAFFDMPKSAGLEDLTVERSHSDIFASLKLHFDYLKQFKWTKV